MHWARYHDMIAEKAGKSVQRRWGIAVSMGNNPRMRAARQVLATGLVVVLSLMVAGDLCQGWSADADARRACCERMANHCATVTADTCCAQKEQRSTRELPPSPAQPARDAAVGPLVTLIAPLSQIDIEAPVASTRPRAYLLHAVFLI